jgi:hypothetical protein
MRSPGRATRSAEVRSGQGLIVLEVSRRRRSRGRAPTRSGIRSWSNRVIFSRKWKSCSRVGPRPSILSESSVWVTPSVCPWSAGCRRDYPGRCSLSCSCLASVAAPLLSFDGFMASPCRRRVREPPLLPASRAPDTPAAVTQRPTQPGRPATSWNRVQALHPRACPAVPDAVPWRRLLRSGALQPTHRR